MNSGALLHNEVTAINNVYFKIVKIEYFLHKERTSFRVMEIEHMGSSCWILSMAQLKMGETNNFMWRNIIMSSNQSQH